MPYVETEYRQYGKTSSCVDCRYITDPVNSPSCKCCQRRLGCMEVGDPAAGVWGDGFKLHVQVAKDLVAIARAARIEPAKWLLDMTQD